MTLRRRSVGSARHQARRVAFWATAIALVVYLLAGAAADVVILHHLSNGLSARLAHRLHSLEVSIAGRPAGSSVRATVAAGSSSDDPDDAPIFAWWVPTGARHAQTLTAGSPVLAVSHLAPSTTLTLSGRAFRVDSASVGGGRVVVASSEAQISNARNTLLAIEAALLPIMAASFFVVALLIGRRAAGPIELARRQQLDFTADASHELRTPLTVIEAEVGLSLASERTGDAYREALARVAEETARLRTIVDDLLWLARADVVPALPASEDVDLAAVTASTIERFQPLASRRGLTMTFDASGDRLTVQAPVEWLERLVSVLVDNACRYVDAGGKLEVRTVLAGGRPTLSVEDSGPGFTETTEIVRRFRRGTARPGGAGLGLSIAETIVQATAAQWELGTSALGGASVKVSWPLAER